MKGEDRKQIFEAATEVFKVLGSYHNEKVYQNALFMELGDVFARTEEVIPIMYKTCYVGFQRVDLAWKQYIVEIKTLNNVTRKEYGQCYRYARSTAKTVVLLNFSPEGVSMEVFVPAKT